MSFLRCSAKASRLSFHPESYKKTCMFKLCIKYCRFPTFNDISWKFVPVEKDKDLHNSQRVLQFHFPSPLLNPLPTEFSNCLNFSKLLREALESQVSVFF